VEYFLVPGPAPVPAVPVTLIVADVVTACTLPHFSIIKWLEGPGYATLVVIGGGATFAVDVAKK